MNTTNQTFIPYNPNTVITGNPNQWYNPLMFSLQTMVPCPNNPALICGMLGDAARGLLPGPGLTNWDFSLSKIRRCHLSESRAGCNFAPRYLTS